ncbi:hypothetical protein ACP4OV_030471 [Aristida adscensionis]
MRPFQPWIGRKIDASIRTRLGAPWRRRRRPAVFVFHNDDNEDVRGEQVPAKHAPFKRRRRWLVANSVDDAARQILDLLWSTDDSEDTRKKSLFFHGWRGLGASSVLRAIARLLKSTSSSDSDKRNHFTKILHVDCTLWKSRRELQKKIAEELGLHHLAQEFDRKNEEDDFKGVDERSRGEITNIGKAIFHSLVNERSLLIFHCGTDESINLEDFGIPTGKLFYGKILWTRYREFQFGTPTKFVSTSMNINARSIEDETFLSLLHQDAVELICHTGMDSINPEQVVRCFLYLVFLLKQEAVHKSIADSDDNHWFTHSSKYWICDGILHGDKAWDVADALHGLILVPLGLDPIAIARIVDSSEFMVGQTKLEEEGVSVMVNYCRSQRDLTIPTKASSYFLTSEVIYPLELQIDMFQPASNLRVLKLCKCSFDFSSPPFFCCLKLKFLWLDHCTDNGKKQSIDVVPCFPNLWVLDLHFTEYVYLPHVAEMMRDIRELNAKGVSWKAISQAWKKLQNVRKLRITESSDMLILDGCSSLEHVMLEKAPLLEIFSFDGYGQAKEWTQSLHLPKDELRPKAPITPHDEPKVSKITLEGCARLHSIFLRALPYLEELNLSATAIKKLDLGAMDIPQLKKLFLLGCEQLHCCLLQEEQEDKQEQELEQEEQEEEEEEEGDEDEEEQEQEKEKGGGGGGGKRRREQRHPELEVLYVDTRGQMRPVVCCGKKEHRRGLDFVVQMAIQDARFLWSAMQSLYSRISNSSTSMVHLHISSTISSQVHIARSSVPMRRSLTYKDSILAEDVAQSALILWDSNKWLEPLDYHVEIGEGSQNLESMQDSVAFRNFAENSVRSLHIHDHSTINVIPSSPWKQLRWCHMERCPKLHTVFLCPTNKMSRNFCESLEKFSGIDLLMAYYIWEKGINNQFKSTGNLVMLKHIYLNNCPRLIHVLPISFNLPSLETIHIECCSNLKYIFPMDDQYPEEIAASVEFKNLKHIKLQYLHSLEQICESRLLSAPVLETITLRDCRVLRRLPSVLVRDPKPFVDCEKDCWDKLEWDESEVFHHPSLYRTRHSAYYKKTTLKVSFLRFVIFSVAMVWNVLAFSTAMEVISHEASGGLCFK